LQKYLLYLGSITALLFFFVGGPERRGLALDVGLQSGGRDRPSERQQIRLLLHFQNKDVELLKPEPF